MIVPALATIATNSMRCSALLDAEPSGCIVQTPALLAVDPARRCPAGTRTPSVHSTRRDLRMTGTVMSLTGRASRQKSKSRRRSDFLMGASYGAGVPNMPNLGPGCRPERRRGDLLHLGRKDLALAQIFEEASWIGVRIIELYGREQLRNGGVDQTGDLALYR